MLKLDPLKAPVGFKNSTSIKSAKTSTASVFGKIPKNTPLLSTAVPKFSTGEYWSNFKGEFAKVSEKCAYCELDAVGPSDGDVEHYRPKGSISKLDKKNQGEETPDLVRVKGRKFQQGCKTGYWWLAYDWANYLLSCGVCNRKWKRDLFPVKKGTNLKSRPSPGCEKTEVPLLLNPYIALQTTYEVI